MRRAGDGGWRHGADVRVPLFRVSFVQLHNVEEPTVGRTANYSVETDPRKKADPVFPDSDVVELINAPARALAADVLASEAFAAEVAKVFPDSTAFGQAVEGLLCQAARLRCPQSSTNLGACYKQAPLNRAAATALRAAAQQATRAAAMHQI